jgi:hypothetical protein
MRIAPIIPFSLRRPFGHAGRVVGDAQGDGPACDPRAVRAAPSGLAALLRRSWLPLTGPARRQGLGPWSIRLLCIALLIAAAPDLSRSGVLSKAAELAEVCEPLDGTDSAPDRATAPLAPAPLGDASGLDIALPSRVDASGFRAACHLARGPPRA